MLHDLEGLTQNKETLNINSDDIQIEEEKATTRNIDSEDDPCI